MKCTLLALLSLAAVPALATEVKTINGQTTYVGVAEFETVALSSSGSLAGRAAARAALEERAAAATFCQLPDSEVPGAPSQARNIDGVCLSTGACLSNPGARSFAGPCPSGTQCCVKNDCAGQNSNSACVIPGLPNDPLPPGRQGGVVSGECPAGLECFQINGPA